MKTAWRMLCLAIPVVILGACAGCGGFSGSHSISPATFLLPGFGAAKPSTPEPAPVPPPAVTETQIARSE